MYTVKEVRVKVFFVYDSDELENRINEFLKGKRAEDIREVKVSKARHQGHYATVTYLVDVELEL